MKTEEKLKMLRECSDFSSEEKLMRFDNILSTIDVDEDFSIFPELFMFFSDDCYDDCVMFALIHTVESLETKKYIQLLLKNIEKIFERSNYWAKVLITRIMNDKGGGNLLTENLVLGNKDVLLRIFDSILEDEAYDNNQKQIAFCLKAKLTKE